MAAKLWNWRLWAGFGLSIGALVAARKPEMPWSTRQSPIRLSFARFARSSTPNAVNLARGIETDNISRAPLAQNDQRGIGQGRLQYEALQRLPYYFHVWDRR
jgi:hypothetical protein